MKLASKPSASPRMVRNRVARVAFGGMVAGGDVGALDCAGQMHCAGSEISPGHAEVGTGQGIACSK